MSNHSHDLYDTILRELPKDGAISDTGEYHAVDLQYLKSCGYLELTYTATGSIYVIALTNTGMKFISEGGFKEMDRQKRIDEEDKELQRRILETSTRTSKEAIRISKISLAIAAVAAIAAVISMIK
ncbi:hypothetical protein [Pedobacter antarcticus]|uniref:hypothetical protein n=1 Tax=Pedobacter antarcticus TaxID=34086 RepID=UPI00292F2670|nr:hypothetical protein [Pedobacter antarcticus]